MTAIMPDSTTNFLEESVLPTDRFGPIWIEPEAVTPVTCEPWCADGSGHADVEVAEDQWCHGREHRLPMRLEGFSIDGGVGQDYLTTHPAKSPHEDSKVYIGHGETRGVHLTPVEAEKFAQHLLLVVAEIRSAA